MSSIKRFIKKNFGQWIYRRQLSPVRKKELINWNRSLQDTMPRKLSDASFDVFTYHGEDGILCHLLEKLGNVPNTFVDIGSGDCIKSNYASLVVHFNWNGLFIDKNAAQLAVGRSFYRGIIKGGADIKFIEATITAQNVNELIAQSIAGKKIGVLSIDIDGNDFWIWQAISTIDPEIVVIEAKVEFGYRSIAVPEGPHNHAGIDPEYNGASVEAFRKLGAMKGYKLAGANKQGYNLFFVKGSREIPAVTSAEVLNDKGTINSFYKEEFFTSHQFMNI